VLERLRELKEELSKRYKVRYLGVFGSAARGQLTEESDIDLLVEFESDADLFDLVALADFLEEKLGRRVDIVSKRALRDEIKSAVLKELIPV